MRRPCLDCGVLVRSGSRCQPCYAASKRIYKGRWPAQSKAQRAAVPYCQSCGSINDLTADHVVPGDPRTLQTLCRACNSAKANRGRA